MPTCRCSSTPPWPELFDPRTGAAYETLPTQFALFYGNDVRFRLAGIQHAFDRGAYIVEPERPWRADWLTRRDLAGRLDAAARAGDDHRLRQAGPADAGAPVLTIAVGLARPVDAGRSRSSRTSSAGAVDPAAGLARPPGPSSACRPGGSATVTIRTPSVSGVYRDPTKGPSTGVANRPVGILLRTVALADEAPPMKRCPS